MTRLEGFTSASKTLYSEMACVVFVFGSGSRRTRLDALDTTRDPAIDFGGSMRVLAYLTCIIRSSHGPICEGCDRLRQRQQWWPFHLRGEYTRGRLPTIRSESLPSVRETHLSTSRVESGCSGASGCSEDASRSDILGRRVTQHIVRRQSEREPVI